MKHKDHPVILNSPETKKVRFSSLLFTLILDLGVVFCKKNDNTERTSSYSPLFFFEP